MCFNRAVAERMSIAVDDAQFEPVTLADSSGRSHAFHVRRRLCATGQVVEAFELVGGAPGGYQFGILGEARADPMELFARLYERMRRGLAREHLVGDKYGTHLIFPGPVRGRIASDYGLDPEPLPVVVIDGREFSWEEFGRMLLSFEGWQFRLEIIDRTDEA